MNQQPTWWIEELTHRANIIYTHSARFRRNVRGHGNAGRDYLWMFMRHWLAALIQRHHSRFFARLPDSYCVAVERRREPEKEVTTLSP
jgi:hypothetical protein